MCRRYICMLSQVMSEVSRALDCISTMSSYRVHSTFQRDHIILVGSIFLVINLLVYPKSDINWKIA